MGMKVLSVRQDGNRYVLFQDWNSACRHVQLYDAASICTIPLGFVQTKELLSDDDGGNHVMSYKPKWRPPGKFKHSYCSLTVCNTWHKSVLLLLL